MKEDSPTDDAQSTNFDFDADNAADLIQEATVTVAGEDELGLQEMMADIVRGHYELDAYRRGAITYVDALNEHIDVARAEGDRELAGLLVEVRNSCLDLCDRIEGHDGVGTRDAADFVADEDGGLELAADAEDRVIVNDSLDHSYDVTD